MFLLIDASIPAKSIDLEYASWLGQNQVISFSNMYNGEKLKKMKPGSKLLFPKIDFTYFLLVAIVFPPLFVQGHFLKLEVFFLNTSLTTIVLSLFFPPKKLNGYSTKSIAVNLT